MCVCVCCVVCLSVCLSVSVSVCTTLYSDACDTVGCYLLLNPRQPSVIQWNKFGRPYLVSTYIQKDLMCIQLCTYVIAMYYIRRRSRKVYRNRLQRKNTVKPETLTSRNFFDKFGESGSNCQTFTFKVKPPSKISLQYKTKISAFTSISPFLLSNSLNQISQKFNNAKVSSSIHKENSTGIVYVTINVYLVIFVVSKFICSAITPGQLYKH